RYGHMAVWHSELGRLFVYGGASSLGALPDDPAVYAIRIDIGARTATWTRCSLESGSETPAARTAFAADVTGSHWHRSMSGPALQRVFVFAGRKAGGTVTND